MTQIITNSMPMGVPGDLSRSHAIVESYNQNVTTPVGRYGVPVKLGAVADTISPIAAAGTSASVVGFLVRDFPSQGGSLSNEAFGVAVPPLSGPLSVMKEGYMVVKCNAGVPAKEGLVYMRIGAADADKPMGGIEAALVADETVLLVGAQFMGAADADGNAEIRFRVGN